MKIKLTKVQVLAAVTSLMLSLLLAACGGGGSGNTGTPTSPGTSGSTAANAPVALDPYTNQAAPGTPNTSVTGEVFNSGPTAGAVITAYLMNADGTNGMVIGSTTTGAGGAFSLTLTQAPSASANYVRLVATGGTFTSTADGTTQTNGVLELVTPYITTAFNNFIITPLTYLASQRLINAVPSNGTLEKAYTAGASMVVSLIGDPDNILPNNTTHAGVDYLALVPGSPADTFNAYADALNAIEVYGVDFDLPSAAVEHVFTKSELTGNPSYMMPDGTSINVGQWQGGTFNPQATYTLATMQPTGYPYGSMHQYIMWEYANTDCRSGNDAAFYARFPIASGEPATLNTGTCAAFESYVSALNAKVATNHRSASLVATPGYTPSNVPVVGAGT
jgi:hypothetical protein